MTKRRIEYIDIMKGLGIIIVMLQHYRWLPSEDNSLLTRMIFASHMPMFFFVSGMFLPYRRSFSQMLGRSLKKLMLPWLIFITAGILLIDVMCGSPMNYIPNKILFTTNVPLWFLRVLTLAIVAGWLLAVTCTTRRSRYVALAFLAVLSLAAFPMSDYFHTLSDLTYFFIYGATFPEFCGLMVFLWAGHTLACETEVQKLDVSRKSAALILAGACAAAHILNPGIMRWHHMIYSGSPLTIWLSAWCGIVAFGAAAFLLKGVKPLAVIGSCTLIILGIHYIPLQIADRLWDMPRHQAAWPSIAFTALAVLLLLWYRKKRQKIF